MAKMTVVEMNGNELQLPLNSGSSVMEVIRAGGAEMLGLCGGCISCGSCHVYVDESWIDRLPPPSNDERGVLDCLPEHKPSSRLSCQLECNDSLDGLRVTIAAAE